MAVRMATDFDIPVTRETIRRWCHELGVSLDAPEKERTAS
jgi:transposase-like protein